MRRGQNTEAEKLKRGSNTDWSSMSRVIRKSEVPQPCNKKFQYRGMNSQSAKQSNDQYLVQCLVYHGTTALGGARSG